MTTSICQNTNKDMYVYDIPLSERKYLCSILDENNVWPDLAVKHMGYKDNIIHEIKRVIHMGNSPSDELITMWGIHNHTVTELFILLSRMQQYTAMDAIKNFIDNKYHRLIVSGQPDLSSLLNRNSTTSNNSRTSDTEEKNLNNPARNKNNQIEIRIVESEKILNCQPISNENNESKQENNNNNISTSDSLDIKNVNEYASTIPQIDYQELLIATDKWNDNNKLGQGGFGTVFKGMWKYTAVAIKRIEYRGTGSSKIKIQMQQSLNELRYLNSARHDNILPLYGYSINGDEPCLVYQLMAGGSLEQRLSTKANQNPLSWRQRVNIAQGTARGLQYLHTFKEKPLIHGDIKPANILLDPCGQPKIGDFGLAREGPNSLNSSMEVSRVYGTKPYLPVEFLGCRSLSTKVDTYSFGVVLFELVTGLRAYDVRRVYKFLTKHVAVSCDNNVKIEEMIDKSCQIDIEGLRICETMIALGRICTADRPEHRPEMVAVLRHLTIS